MFSHTLDKLNDHFVDVLGVRFHRYTQKEAIEHILGWIDEKSKRLVITAGPEFVMIAQRDDDVRNIAHRADLVTADGIGIVWAASMQRKPVPERVTGVELGLHLFETAEARNQALRVYILGSTPESLARCLASLRTRYPKLIFAGHHGFFSTEDLPRIYEELNDFNPDVWLVGLGQPRQEKFIFSSLAKIPPCVGIGIGGSIDVWGGTVPRAPKLVQALNVEWLYRLVKQPSRWRRQLALPRFAWQVLKKAGD